MFLSNFSTMGHKIYLTEVQAMVLKELFRGKFKIPEKLDMEDELNKELEEYKGPKLSKFHLIGFLRDVKYLD